MDLFAYFNRFELELPSEDCVYECSGPGPADDAVAYWLNKVDFSGISAEDIREELHEYGAWDEDELADDEQNKHRLLWLAAGQVRDAEHEDYDGQPDELTEWLDFDPDC